jgi:glycogen debranching enzyme
VSEPAFSRDDTGYGLRRYWRGPTWVNSAWLVWLGMRRLGYAEQADVLRARLGHTVATAGLREYYDPYDGQGMGAVDFGWSTLMLELTEPDPRAATSYLGSG